MLIGAVSIALLLGLQFSLYRILDRFGDDPLADARIPFARNTIAAAKAYMPWGSGLGSFVPVYAMTEPPRDVLANTFANHAHNDILEVWLEMGAVGLVILAAVAIWWLLRVVAVWRPASGREIDAALARVGTIIIALLIGHSVVDYPLRTRALMAVFAFAAALTVPPPAALQDLEDERNGNRRATDARSPGGRLRMALHPMRKPRQVRLNRLQLAPRVLLSRGDRTWSGPKRGASNREVRATLGTIRSVSSVSKPQWWTKQAARSPSACNACSRLYRCSQGYRRVGWDRWYSVTC